jgi:hypothetical protein
MNVKKPLRCQSPKSITERIIYIPSRFIIITVFQIFTRNNRSIASIIYIPNSGVLGLFLDKYNNQGNDMVNLSYAQKMMPHLFDNFPIYMSTEGHTAEQTFVSRTYPRFNLYLSRMA